MRNLAVLTARLSGRPLLMREEDAHAWATRLLSLDPAREQRPKGFLGWLGRAREMRTAELKPEDIAHAQIGCSMPLWMGEPDDAGFGWVLKGDIAVISIEGPLLDEGYVSEWSDWMIPGYDTLAQTFAEVQADSRVQGVFYRLKTPGGMASQGLPDFCSQLLASRASAGGSKPIYAWAEAAYSAGYWIFASVDRGFAPPIGGVGSIGAVQTHCDMSGMYAKDGIVMTPIQFGVKKTDGASFKPLSDGAQADWQSEIDFLGNMFVDGVVAGRPNLTREAILATQASCYLAGNTDQARSGLALGLVDAIASEQEAFAALQAAIGGSRSPSAALATAAQRTAAVARDASPAQNLETDMSLKNRLLGGARPTQPAPAAAAAQPAAVSPENPVTEPDEGMEICSACDGTGDDEAGETCPSCDGTGQVEVATAEAAAPAAAAPAANAAAAAIAASPEAEAHPQSALAAIKAGLSLEQFKAMAGVSGSGSAAEAAIDRRMRGARRLNADGPTVATNGSVLGAALLADANAKRAAVK